MDPKTITWMLVLASASPRRRELMALTGCDVEICPVLVDEMVQIDERAEALAIRLARAKARAAAAECTTYELVLAADTVVVASGTILGKPLDALDAERMLLMLRGREHEVITALVFLKPASGEEMVETCKTVVPMRAYEKIALQAYIAGGSPLDKAGAYGIQDREFNPVELSQMEGCFANVMGLPLCHMQRALGRLGHDLMADLPTRCMAYTGYDCSVYQEILRGKL
jgi:MAF protein